LFRLWPDLAMLAIQSQQVIWLRIMKLALGVPLAHREARLMVTEKMAAAVHESGRLMLGASTKSVVKRYRKRVNANVRRLST
jgi:phosphoribosylformylglycinamidine (FGAM) synthase-like amidotransferase family enzyme